MRRWWFWLAFGALGVLGGLYPARVWAADPPTFPLVQVALWPEYDRPEMLVMYIVHLPEDTALPTEVALRIPARVEAPSAVAVRTAEGRLINAEHRIEADPTSPDWRVVVVTATELTLQVEYYDPALEKQGAERHFVYEWPGDWQVQNLTVEVQHPRTGVAIQIDPEPTRAEERDDALRYYLLEFGTVAPGDRLQVEVTYQNPTGELSQSPMQGPPPAVEPTESPSAGRPQPLVTFWPWALAAVGVLLLVAAGWMYWQGSRPPRRPVGPPRGRTPRRRPTTEAVGEVRYCPQCGTRARPGDRFCRICGTPLR